MAPPQHATRRFVRAGFMASATDIPRFVGASGSLLIFSHPGTEKKGKKELRHQLSQSRLAVLARKKCALTFPYPGYRSNPVPANGRGTRKQTMTGCCCHENCRKYRISAAVGTDIATGSSNARAQESDAVARRMICHGDMRRFDKDGLRSTSAIRTSSFPQDSASLLGPRGGDVRASCGVEVARFALASG